MSREKVEQHIPESLRGITEGHIRKVPEYITRYLINIVDRKREEDYFPAQVFREGAKWLEQNQDAEKFFLVLDSFDPHEPWDPPVQYRRMYDPDDDSIDFLASLYREANQVSSRALKRMRAQDYDSKEFLSSSEIIFYT